MKLTFSPASPFARKVRIAAIELGLIDKIEFMPATVAPGQANDEYSRITPLKKLPVLITDHGEVILDSYVIVRISRRTRRRPADPGLRPAPLAGEDGSLPDRRHARFHAAVPLRENGAAAGSQWQAWSDDHWNRAWTGMARFENRPDVLSGPLDIVQIGLVCVLGYAISALPICGWRKAYPKLDAFHQKMLQRPSVKVSVPPPA